MNTWVAVQEKNIVIVEELGGQMTASYERDTDSLASGSGEQHGLGIEQIYGSIRSMRRTRVRI